MILAEGIPLTLPTTHTGEQIDLAALVDTYSPLLFRVAYSIVRSHAEAEDTVQDTFVRVLEHRRSLPAIRDLRPWLTRICWNLALDRRRRKRPEQMDEAFTASLIGEATPADQRLAESEQFAAVLRELDRMPKAERQALLLSALEELSTTEVANVMSKSESAVRALVFRARQRLRSRLAQGGRA